MLDPINLVIGGSFLAFAVTDSLFPARRFPQARWWRLRGGLAALLYLTLATYAPFLWAGWLKGPLLFDLTGLPLAIQVPLGYAAIQLVAYWWHRAMHASDFLFRVFHQMHHSVERMDGWGALYHHPLDIVGFTFMASFALTMLVGVGPEAAAVIGVVGAVAVFFTHWNVRTPPWIGYVFQRPEGHGRHHERGHHAGNYAELALFDQLFGTWDNPAVWDGEAGFSDGASSRWGAMLAFRDVSGATPEAEAPPPAFEAAVPSSPSGSARASWSPSDGRRGLGGSS